MVTVTREFVNDHTIGGPYGEADVKALNDLLAVEAHRDDALLNAALRDLSEERCWELYDLAGDLNASLATEIDQHDSTLVVGVNWLALILKVAAQGHLD